MVSRVVTLMANNGLLEMFISICLYSSFLELE